MDTPLQISFRNMDRSPAVELRIRERVEKLEKYCGHLTSCQVTVDVTERRHQKGQLFHVRVDIGVPGKHVVVNRHPKDNHALEDVYVAIRDAFDAARRQLEDHVRKTRGKIKSHDVPLHGTVARLFSNEGYGFIAVSDGNEIYFHENCVLHEDFGRLEVGTDVRFVLAEGDSAEGPLASTVYLIGKHHLVDRNP